MILASHRGPRTLEHADGKPRWVASTGGLIEMLKPALRGPGSRWIAVAEAPQLASGSAIWTDDAGPSVEHVAVPSALYHGYYSSASTELWNLFHGLGTDEATPAADRTAAWSAYRDVGSLMAAHIAATAAGGEVVVVHDYHLMVVPGLLRQLRPDLRIGYFHHIPFSTVAELGAVGDDVATEIMASLAQVPVGFQSRLWASRYRACQEAFGPDQRAETFVAPVSPGADDLRAAADRVEVQHARQRLRELVGERKLIVRVDRADPMKNVLRGVEAVDLLLEEHPELRGAFVFLHHLVPTRGSVAAYRAHATAIADAIEAVNGRWATGGWKPIVLGYRNDRDEALAALTEYDVLVVTPVREGMNLVAQEGPILNARDGIEILSTEAGSYDVLADGVLAVDPLDVPGTARALFDGLDATGDRRAAMAATLRERAATLDGGGDWHDAVVAQVANG